MAIRYQKASARLTTSNQTIYTVPQGVETAIVSFGVCNNVGADTTFSLYVVDSGDSASGTNQYITTKTVSTASPNPLDPITGIVMEEGDYIVAVAANADRLNLRLGIMEISGV